MDYGIRNMETRTKQCTRSFFRVECVGVTSQLGRFFLGGQRRKQYGLSFMSPEYPRDIGESSIGKLLLSP